MKGARLGAICWVCERPLVELPPRIACSCGGVDQRTIDANYPADKFDREYERARARGWED